MRRGTMSKKFKRAPRTLASVYVCVCVCKLLYSLDVCNSNGITFDLANSFSTANTHIPNGVRDASETDDTF